MLNHQRVYTVYHASLIPNAMNERMTEIHYWYPAMISSYHISQIFHDSSMNNEQSMSNIPLLMPPGKQTFTISNWRINYKWSFSIAKY